MTPESKQDLFRGLKMLGLALVVMFGTYFVGTSNAPELLFFTTPLLCAGLGWMGAVDKKKGALLWGAVGLVAGAVCYLAAVS